jgi:hypothetical protein
MACDAASPTPRQDAAPTDKSCTVNPTSPKRFTIRPVSIIWVIKMSIQQKGHAITSIES